MTEGESPRDTCREACLLSICVSVLPISQKVLKIVPLPVKG
jgi:hypothetical protein